MKASQYKAWLAAKRLSKALDDYDLSDTIGQEIAGLLYLHTTREYRDRYNTTYGTKTACGLARSVIEVIVKKLEKENDHETTGTI